MILHCWCEVINEQPAKTTGDRGPEVVMASCETHVHSTIASCGVSASYYPPGISRLFLELFVCPHFGPMSSVTFGFSAFHSAFTSAMWVSEDWGWIQDGPSESWLEILSPGLISSLSTLQTNLSVILGGHIRQAYSIETSGLFDSRYNVLTYVQTGVDPAQVWSWTLHGKWPLHGRCFGTHP